VRELDLIGMLVLPVLTVTVTRGVHVADLSAILAVGRTLVSAVGPCTGLVAPECATPLPGL
jgi:hypothetical protein